MAKNKNAYICTECGANFHRWQGQCNNCNAWNTINECKQVGGLSSPKGSNSAKSGVRSGYSGSLSTNVESLDQVSMKESARTSSGVREFDKVLGGGIVSGSAILVGGSPGAGKSTLLLQVFSYLSASSNVLYVTGEESKTQVANRARRLELPNLSSIKIVSETCVESVIESAISVNAKFLVIDSIQSMFTEDSTSNPGTASQVTACGTKLTQFAKNNDVALFLIGHVTKDGSLAGPMVLEHVIDVSLLFENTISDKYRTLRTKKNRFGSTNELAVFAMTERGMKEVPDPSAIFLDRSTVSIPGSVVTSVLDGGKVILLEIQSLFTEKQSQYENRNVVGIDKNRISMILGVMFKYSGISAKDSDLFINVVSGMKINETSCDLAFAVSIYSSITNTVIPDNLLVLGEVGLGSEVRPTANCNERLNQAHNHKFDSAIIPFGNKRGLNTKCKVYPVKTVAEAFSVIRELCQDNSKKGRGK